MSKKEEAPEEVETVAVPICGHVNADYRTPGTKKGEKSKATLTCELLAGHVGDHTAKKDSAGHEVVNAFWSNAVGRRPIEGPTQFPETLPAGYTERQSRA